MAQNPQMPGDTEIALAAAWLRCNEGAEGESEACAAVADWIGALANERWLRSEARRAGVPVARLRRRLAEQGAAR